MSIPARIKATTTIVAAMTVCDRCGACCRVFPIFASNDDAMREPLIKISARKIPEHQETKEWSYQLHPLPFLSACTFLGQNNLCKIYATRPAVCRRFEAGSEQCQQARAHIGLTPISSVTDS